jgi:hypothetical protein
MECEKRRATLDAVSAIFETLNVPRDIRTDILKGLERKTEDKDVEDYLEYVQSLQVLLAGKASEETQMYENLQYM